jgi:hypothetical protein
MDLGNRVSGIPHNPWQGGPPSPGAQAPVRPGRPSWQVTRWPVPPEVMQQLHEAARKPDPPTAHGLRNVVVDAPATAQPALEMLTLIAGAPAAAAAQAAPPLAPVAAVPTIRAGFDGIPYTGSDPPDPAVAVGPNHVMTAVNAQFAVTAKNSPQPLTPIPLAALFAPSLPPFATYLFDPKLAYDHFADRYIAVVGLKRESPPGSWIMLAVTQTNDPTGGWNTWALDMTLDGWMQTANWADYPALGFDEQAIYISANMFQFNGALQYAKLRILNKSEVYAPSGSPGPAVRWFDITRLLNPNGIPVFSLRPAIHHRGSPGPAYFVNALFPAGNTLTGWTLTNPLGAWQNPPAAPVFTNTAIACQPYDLAPSARQPAGGPPISTDDTRLLNAVYYGDGPAAGFWTAHTSKFSWPGDSEARSVAQWYQLDIAGSGVVQQGRYGVPGVYHFFPAVRPLANGDVYVVFGRCSPAAGDFAGLRAAGRRAADPPGTLSNSVVLQAGQGISAGSPGPDGAARFGDYFSVANDPSDDAVAWLCGEYAGPAGAWATHISAVSF